MITPYIVAVAGGSGSGKTFLAQAIHSKMGNKLSSIISQDSYYIDQSNSFDHDGGSVNFDHPNSIDFDLLAVQLKQLKNCQEIEVPIYDFATHTRKQDTTKQTCKKLILIDGILILHHKKIRDLFDEIIFVKTPEEVRYERRLVRDVEERGRTPEGVYAQFHKQVKPMHDQYVEPSKEFADFITSGTDISDLEKTIKRLYKKLTDQI